MQKLKRRKSKHDVKESQITGRRGKTRNREDMQTNNQKKTKTKHTQVAR